jgi:hypothetical protein
MNHSPRSVGHGIHAPPEVVDMLKYCPASRFIHQVKIGDDGLK